MTDRLSQQTLRYLQGGACLVVILWGISAASGILVPILMGLLLAYSFLPLPSWLMKRFHLGKGAAIVLAGGLVGALLLGFVLLLYWRFTHIRGQLPIYEEHFMSFYRGVAVFLQGRGIEMPGADAVEAYVSRNLPEVARMVLPEAAGFLVDGLLIAVLAAYFLVTIAEQASAKQGYFALRLAYYGGDVQRYIAITAKTNAIAALATFVLLAALQVDFPLVWGALYFLMAFIPTVGFIIAIVPPILLALVMSGWTTALLLFGGFILINLLQEYGLNPIFMKRGVNVSFIEIILSLMFWPFLLGPAGAILAVPLTIAVRKFLDKFRSEDGLAGAPSE